MTLVNKLENLQELSMAVLLLCSFFYLRQLKKMRKERKFSRFELVTYRIGQLAAVVLAYTTLFLIRSK